ncbi:MAG: carboxypeptidase regulatory-like domain-containing protein [Planctomycetota bacterium]
MNHFLQSLSESELWALNVLIHVTVFALMAVGFQRLARRSAIMRWWLLGTALMLMLLSPATVFVSQLFGVGVLTMTRNSSASEPRAFAEPSSTDENPETSPETIIPELAAEVRISDASRVRIDDQTSHAAPAPLPTDGTLNDLEQDVERPMAWSNRVFLLLLLAWCLGTCWKLLRFVVGWRRVGQMTQQAAVVNVDLVLRTFDQACQEVKPAVRPMLLTSSRVSSPVAAGIRRPVVILPDALVSDFSPCELKAILLHEIAHVARRDPSIVVLQSAVTSVFWFHPLVLWVNRQFAQAREEVCDNFVLRSTNAQDFSRTLLSLAKQISSPELPAAVGMLNDWSLESRVAGLLAKNRSTETRLNRRAAATVGLLVMGLAAAGVCLTISARADEPTVDDEQISDSESEFGRISTQNMDGDKPAKPATTGEAVASRSGEPLPESTEFRFAGVVLDPEKQPVSGARVYISQTNAQPLARTDADGQFEFTRTKGELPKNAAWGLMKIVSVKEGFGIASSPILRFETTGAGRQDLQARNPGKEFQNKTPPAVLQLRQDDVPIRGRIVDLEGEPVSNVNVQLRFVDNLYARYAFDAVTTDVDGRFLLRGIGRDRVVRLVAKGDRTEFSVFFARTANVPTKTKTTRTVDPFGGDPVPVETNKVTYGADFIHAVGPSVPLEGRVTDSKTGKPIAGVFLSGAQIGNYQVTPAQEELSAVTDEDGRYRLTGLPLGSNSLFASLAKEGYLKRRVQYDINADKPVVTGDFTLVEGIEISGQVTDAKTKEPIPGRVEYYAARTNENFPRGAVNTSFRTGADGRYRLNVVPGEGFLTVRSRRSGYLLGDLDDAARAQTGTNLPFVPTKTAGLLPLEYHLIQSIEISETEAAPVQDLQLKRQPRITARLVDTEGEPVNGATIEEIVMMPPSGYARGTNAMTLEADQYQCREFTPGGITDLIARHKQRGLIGRLSLTPSSREAKLPIITKNAELAKRVKIDRVSITEASNVSIVMRPAATVKGRVVDKNGMPRVIRIGGHGRSFKTDDDGRFELTMVLPNYPKRIQAMHPDRMELIGTLFDEIILEPGEVRDLGNVRVRPNTQ